MRPQLTQAISVKPHATRTACWVILLAGVIAVAWGLIGWTQPAKPSLEVTSAGHAPSSTAFLPIEVVQIGSRVVGVNPLGEFDASLGTEVDPPTWRKLTLRALKNDGSEADVVLLRPLWWLELRLRESDGTVFISVPEVGIHGSAELLAVEPCPAIVEGNGAVVTGTFRHASAQTLNLYIDGLPDPIGTTPNHPIWSVDRGNFVRAEELQIGERLQGDRGPLALNAIEKNQGSEPVFNLEIFGQHVFRVSSLGVLAHNNDECFEFVTLADGSTVKRFKLEIEPGIVIRPGVNTSLPLRVTGELPVGQMRTPEEVKQARNFFERNRDAAKKWYEERTGRPWPQNATHAEHPRALKDGGDPLLIEPGFNGPDAPHMIPGQDGLTDFQRWGRLGGRPPNK